MRQFILSLWFLLGAATLCFADTTFVAGSVQGVWDTTGNPYIVRGLARVEDPSSLLIQPGCVVVFDTSAKLVVLGSLRALGTETDSIYFTCDTLTNFARWLGLRFVSAEANSQLSYCVIENGRANRENDDRYAGGIEIQSSNPLIEHCTIRNNFAAVDGGGIYVRDNSRPTFNDCLILRNRANIGGGGMMVRTSRPTLNRCEFRENFCAFQGGGLICRNGSVLTARECLFQGNVAADSGGAIYSLHSTTVLTLEQCVISGNVAARGGGVYVEQSAPYFYRTRLTDNVASLEGGALYGDNFSSAFVNCIFERNLANGAGGAVYLKNSPTAALEFCTLYGDSAPLGGDLFCSASPGLVRNSLFANWRNGGTVAVSGDNPPTVQTCCFYGGAGGVFIGSRNSGQGTIDTVNFNLDSCDSWGNLYSDPLGVDFANGNYALTDDSPCISAGSTSFESFDFSGDARPRPIRTQPDIGAYESDRGGSGFICGSVAGSIGPGDIVVGCSVTVDSTDTLTIEAGTNLLFAGRFSLTVYGTLLVNGTESDSVLFTRRNNDPANNWRGLRFQPDSRGQCSYAIFEYAQGTQFNADSGCGAIFCNSANPRFAHCSIRNNTATFRGGGISCYNNALARFDTCDIVNNISSGFPFSMGGGVSEAGSRLRMRQCWIAGNSSTWGGGGIHADSGTANFDGCTITGNSSRSGGGVYSLGSGVNFTNCQISGNTCTQDGAGVYARSFAHFTRCILQSNFGTGIRGGGVYCGFYAPVFDHCIFAQNVAESGGGLHIESASPEVTNCTVARNTATSGDGIYLLNSAPQINSTIICMGAGSGIYFRGGSAFASIEYCDLFGNPAGNFAYFQNDHTYGPEGIGELSRTNANGDPCDDYNNVLLDAQFVDGPGGNYQLLQTSPCINAGDPGLPHDGDGSVTDIGAYFYSLIYHAPAAFDLLAPANEDTVRADDVQFCWQASFDEDRNDSVLYKIVLSDEIGNEYSRDVGRDTCISLNLTELGIGDTIAVFWYVEAHSQQPDTSVRSNSLWIFYRYRTTAAREPGTPVPAHFALTDIYPNPFNAEATVRFAVPRRSQVRLDLFDLTGRFVEQLQDAEFAAGYHSVRISGAGHASGVYFVRMTAGAVSMSRKLLLLK